VAFGVQHAAGVQQHMEPPQQAGEQHAGGAQQAGAPQQPGVQVSVHSFFIARFLIYAFCFG
jgi:hypothetical protein